MIFPAGILFFPAPGSVYTSREAVAVTRGYPSSFTVLCVFHCLCLPGIYSCQAEVRIRSNSQGSMTHEVSVLVETGVNGREASWMKPVDMSPGKIRLATI